MEYVIRFTQSHETFRLAEIEALAVLEGIEIEILSYSLNVSTSPVRRPLLLTMSQVTILLCKIALGGSGYQAGQKKHSGQVHL
jgi:tRNA G10  N-methylase Trm11